MRPPKGTLLDTHVLLWTLAGSSELGSRFRNLLGSHGPVFFSAISLVELAIKSSVKKLPQDQYALYFFHQVYLIYLFLITFLLLSALIHLQYVSLFLKFQ